jgi:GTP-binding protein
LPPRVVLAGRPNAGKSTLFNRLLRRPKAVVDPTPGVTRDANEALATLDGRTVRLVDTGGLEGSAAEGLDEAIRAHGLAAMQDAALVVYVLDGKAGLSPADEDAARLLRRQHLPVLFVVNKLDSPRRAAGAVEFHRLGSDALLEVSAEHGHGIGELIESILARVDAPLVHAAPTGIRVGLIGRPNVGKSSLANRLLGYARTLVHDVAGTTRDAVDTELETDGTRYVLIDTAGLRRRARIQVRLEREAAGKSLEALTRSDVVVVVLDAIEGVTTQDQRLAALAWQEGRGLVLVANKLDRCAEPRSVVDEIRRRLPTLEAVPIVTTSALTGAGVDGILPAVRRVAQAHDCQIQTAKLNDVIAAAVAAKEPPLVRSRRPRIYYAAQVGRRPPTIAVFASAPRSIHPSYQRYLQHQIAEAFALHGTPVRVQFRARH